MMELKDFIGKVVVSSDSKQRFILEKITAGYLEVRGIKPNDSGYPSHYRFETGTVSNPVSKGKLLFEDASLTLPFIMLYEDYCSSKEGREDRYIYWMNKD